jgi:hypothetical protein
MIGDSGDGREATGTPHAETDESHTGTSLALVRPDQSTNRSGILRTRKRGGQETVGLDDAVQDAEAKRGG